MLGAVPLLCALLAAGCRAASLERRRLIRRGDGDASATSPVEPLEATLGRLADERHGPLGLDGRRPAIVRGHDDQGAGAARGWVDAPMPGGEELDLGLLAAQVAAAARPVDDELGLDRRTGAAALAASDADAESSWPFFGLWGSSPTLPPTTPLPPPPVPLPPPAAAPIPVAPAAIVAPPLQPAPAQAVAAMPMPGAPLPVTAAPGIIARTLPAAPPASSSTGPPLATTLAPTVWPTVPTGSSSEHPLLIKFVACLAIAVIIGAGAYHFYRSRMVNRVPSHTASMAAMNSSVHGNQTFHHAGARPSFTRTNFATKVMGAESAVNTGR